MQEKLKDKIAGALVGYAIGDALGLGTEFMTADEAKSIYPDSLTDYSQIEMDAHRSPWGHGNYTHDTEFVIMLIENVLRDGELRPLEFARSMADWYGDGHYDISQQMRAVLREPSYRNDPYGTVERIWKQRGKWLEADANWGRVLCAIGYSGAEVDITKVDVDFQSQAGTVAVCRNGAGVDFDEDIAKKVLTEKEIYILVGLNDGEATAEAWGCDLTYDYVKINGDYRT